MLYVAVLLIAIILISLSVHEFAHAWVANRLGDPTAKLSGRVSLNPAAHWDPIGTTLLVGLIFLRAVGAPVIAFGWGKPVPVNPHNLRNPRSDLLKVSLSGPVSNLLFAVLLAFIFKNVSLDSNFQSILLIAIQVNIFLAIFNLIPLPPLDGADIIRYFLPPRFYEYFEQNSSYFMMSIFLLIFLFPSILGSLVSKIMSILL
jgi:Zn-dependent protease